jgi:hypothetical protein
MCPACFASVALLVTGIVSTGGVSAAAVKLLRNTKTAVRIPEVPNIKEKENLK